MLAKIFSGTNIGLDGVLIEVEVDVAQKGLPSLTIVGLPNKAIDEAKDRVRTAIVNSSFEVPQSRITVNLAPANIPKHGSAFDLPIAIGILAASGMIEKNILSKSLFLGELSLEGKLRPTPGVISIAIMAKKKGIVNFFIPQENAQEAILVEGINIFSIGSLFSLILYLNKQKKILPLPKINTRAFLKEEEYEFDFSDIKGQSQAKRALEIAASGGHNILLNGPPGTGKTMLSRAFPSILPLMDKQEILEVSKIYSIAGMSPPSSLITKRPFRAPHPTTSKVGLIGGGTNPKPGEITLSHRGVLFLDEIPEFPRSVLESLRQPLEDGKVLISRSSGSLTFPARFILLAASNPCPCGYLGHPTKRCRCSPNAILKYRKKLSGPLLERIDIHINVPPVKEDKLTSQNLAEPSKKVRERVIKAQVIQKKRFKGLKIKLNSQMKTRQIRKYCHLNKDAVELLKKAISRLSLSARTYFKIIKVAQTIADLEGGKQINISFIAEALQYRAKENEVM